MTTEPETETVEAELVDDQPASQDTRLTKFDPVKAGLAELTKKYSSGPPADLADAKNYEACRLAVAEMRKKRTTAEKIRKELKADALEYGRKVDSIAKEIIEHISKLEEPFATAKKEFDTAAEIAKREAALAEERRVDGIAKRISTIAGMVGANVSSSSKDIEALFPGLNGDLVSVDEWAMEFVDKARSTLADTMQKLEELHSMKVQQEQFAIEKAKAENEAAEKAEVERIQREKEAAAERERLAKEREALEKERAAIQAERDRIAKEQEERDRAARAEQEERTRLAAEQAKKEQEEQERNAAEEQARINAEIEALKKDQTPVIQPSIPTQSNGASDDYKAAGRAIKGITGDFTIAKTLLDSIIKGDIPHITYTGA